jgi:hypothetical protein
MPTVGCEADAIAFTEEDASSSSSDSSTESSSDSSSGLYYSADGSYSSGDFDAPAVRLLAWHSRSCRDTVWHARGAKKKTCLFGPIHLP